MKINWGTGIVIAFAIFITFILYFVFSVQSNSKYDNELVYEGISIPNGFATTSYAFNLFLLFLSRILDVCVCSSKSSDWYSEW